MMAQARRSFAVIGLGRFGGTVASELARFGNHVMGIDSNERVVTRFADVLTETAIADVTDEVALRDAGLEHYDAGLVAIGDDIEVSILATMNLRLLGVRTIWAKAAHRTHHRILMKIGADRVILPEHEMGRHVAQALNNPALQDYMGLGNGMSLVSVRMPAARAGQTLGDLPLGPALRPLAVMHGTEVIDAPTAATALRADDILVILGRRADLQAFGDRL